MPLFKSLHFSEADIATVTKVFGFWIALGGTLVAGLVVRRFGMMKSLLIGTIAGSASHLSLAWLAAHGHDFMDFALAVGVDGFAYAFAQAILIICMSSLVSTEFATSQYALLTSLCALPSSLLAGASDFIIKETGFATLFRLYLAYGATGRAPRLVGLARAGTPRPRHARGDEPRACGGDGLRGARESSALPEAQKESLFGAKALANSGASRFFMEAKLLRV